MQRWEYMWIYVAQEKGTSVFIANGDRLTARTSVEALNAVGQQGWELVAIIYGSAPSLMSQNMPQFCLKRPIIT